MNDILQKNSISDPRSEVVRLQVYNRMTNYGAKGKHKAASWSGGTVLWVTEMGSLIKNVGPGKYILIFTMQTHSKLYIF